MKLHKEKDYSTRAIVERIEKRNEGNKLQFKDKSNARNVVNNDLDIERLNIIVGKSVIAALMR